MLGIFSLFNFVMFWSKKKIHTESEIIVRGLC